MKTTYFAAFAITATALIVSTQAAPTIFTGGGGDTPLSLSQYGLAPGPTIEATGGNPGGSLLVTVDTPAGGLQNGVAFDRTQIGTIPRTDFTFQFQIVAPRTSSADGFHFILLNTSNFGTTGPGANLGEDPALGGVLGFGFDTWSNQGAFDNPAVPTGSDYDEISLFYNGALIQRIDDTRLLPTPLTLDDGVFHTATGNFNFAGGTATLAVDGNPIFTNTAVPGLAPFESRVQFGGRTGGETENVSIDNVNVSYVPEPTAAALGGVGLALMLRRRRPDPQ
jgi:lectin family protein